MYQKIKTPLSYGSTAVHLDLWGCSGPLTEGATLFEHLCGIVKKYDMRLRTHSLDIWEENKAFNLWLSLQESHIQVETWPEESFVKVTVDLCNYSRDNSQRVRDIAREIQELFKPTGKIQVTEIVRGP